MTDNDLSAIPVIGCKHPPSTAPAVRHVPGEEGTWVFIFGDMLVFAAFFATYVHYRGKEPAVFDTGQMSLNPSWGALMTLLLLTSSLLVVMGLRAVRKGDVTLAPRLFVAAFCCGVGFVGLKAVEYVHHLGEGQTPSANHFFLYFYILTGLHLFHVVLGLGVLVFLWNASRKEVETERKLALVEGGACFWHMVDLLWIVLFPLLYFAR